MTGETPYHQLQIPGASVTIRLRPGLVERLTLDLHEVLASTGHEAGGVLLGSAISDGEIVVEDYDSLPSRHTTDARCYLFSDIDRGRLDRTLALWRPAAESRLHVVGFYRSNLRPTLSLGDEDRRLIAQDLSGGMRILLLVEPGAGGRATLACYLAEGGQLTNAEARLAIGPPKEGIVAAEAPAPPRLPPAETRVDEGRRSSLGLAWIALLLAAAGFLWMGLLQYQLLNTMRAQSVAAWPRPALGLDVRARGPYWYLTWDRTSDCLTGANRGTLLIEDGDIRRNLEFNPAELHTASVIYAPAGTEITYHFKVFGTQDSWSAAESLRVVATLPASTTEMTPLLSAGPLRDGVFVEGLKGPAGLALKISY